MFSEKIVKRIIILIIAIWMANPVLAISLPDIRGLSMDPVSVKDNSESIQNNNSGEYNNVSSKYIEDSATLKGGISELSAIVGKSHLIKFDEPVKRLSITNPSLADIVLISPQEMLLNGKSAGITSLIIWGEEGDPVFFDLYVKNDSTSFLSALKKILPYENLDLKFTNDSNVILSGSVSSSLVKAKVKNLADAYGLKLVDLSESPTPQVMLEVKVAEASRAFTKNIKANFAIGKYAENFKYGIIPDSASQHGLGAIFDGTMNGLRGFSYLPGNDKFSGILSLAEQKGLIKILAEPKLVTLHGNTASFNAGNQVPVPTSIGEGGNVAYEFKNVGVNVSFTPTILEQSGRISLKIAPEVSEIDSSTTIQQQNGAVIYGFKTRKADTMVELNDGQTLVIAGLLQKTDHSTRTQIPLMGDLPIVGKLFRSSEYKKGETELLIFVTPRILKTQDDFGRV